MAGTMFRVSLLALFCLICTCAADDAPLRTGVPSLKLSEESSDWKPSSEQGQQASTVQGSTVTAEKSILKESLPPTNGEAPDEPVPENGASASAHELLSRRTARNVESRTREVLGLGQSAPDQNAASTWSWWRRRRAAMRRRAARIRASLRRRRAAIRRRWSRRRRRTLVCSNRTYSSSSYRRATHHYGRRRSLRYRFRRRYHGRYNIDGRKCRYQSVRRYQYTRRCGYRRTWNRHYRRYYQTRSRMCYYVRKTAKRSPRRNRRYSLKGMRIWMTSLRCRGRENNLASCRHRGWGRTRQCNHRRDIGVCCRSSWRGRCSTVASGGSREGKTRVAGASKYRGGRLEVFHRGQWGTVCNRGFDRRDAKAACRAMGVSAVRATYFTYGGNGRALTAARRRTTGKIWLSGVRCRGHENYLSECSRTSWGARGCDHTRDVQVCCKTSGGTCASNVSNGNLEGALRLRSDNSGSTWGGRLEIRHNRKWGTVCNSGFRSASARVACKQLGLSPVGATFSTFDYRNKRKRLRSSRHLRQRPTGKLRIWLGGLTCPNRVIGSLVSCPHRPWGNARCNHNRDVGVCCRGPFDKTCMSGTQSGTADGRLRLTGAAKWNKGGRLEVRHNRQWGTVCRRGFNSWTAKTACKQMGLPWQRARHFTWGGRGEHLAATTKNKYTPSYMKAQQKAVVEKAKTFLKQYCKGYCTAVLGNSTPKTKTSTLTDLAQSLLQEHEISFESLGVDATGVPLVHDVSDENADASDAESMQSGTVPAHTAYRLFLIDILLASSNALNRLGRRFCSCHQAVPAVTRGSDEWKSKLKAAKESAAKDASTEAALGANKNTMVSVSSGGPSVRMDSGMVSPASSSSAFTNGSGSKSSTMAVAFSTAFAQPPVVTANMIGFDFRPGRNKRVVSQVTNVTSKGFNLVVTSWGNTSMRSAKIAWTALGTGSNDLKMYNQAKAVMSGRKRSRIMRILGTWMCRARKLHRLVKGKRVGRGCRRYRRRRRGNARRMRRLRSRFGKWHKNRRGRRRGLTIGRSFLQSKRAMQTAAAKLRAESIAISKTLTPAHMTTALKMIARMGNKVENIKDAFMEARKARAPLMSNIHTWVNTKGKSDFLHLLVWLRGVLTHLKWWEAKRMVELHSEMSQMWDYHHKDLRMTLSAIIERVNELRKKYEEWLKYKKYGGVLCKCAHHEGSELPGVVNANQRCICSGETSLLQTAMSIDNNNPTVKQVHKSQIPKMEL